MHRLVCFLLGALLLAGCRSISSDPQIGVERTYEIWDVVSNGVAPPETADKVTRQSLTTRKLTLPGGASAYEVASKSSAVMYKAGVETGTLSRTDTAYIRETPEFVIQYGSLRDPRPETTLKLPLASGQTWHISQVRTATVVGSEDVSVKAGTFPTWKIHVVTDLPGLPPRESDIWFDAATRREVMIHSENRRPDTLAKMTSHGELVKIEHR